LRRYFLLSHFSPQPREYLSNSACGGSVARTPPVRGRVVTGLRPVHPGSNSNHERNTHVILLSGAEGSQSEASAESKDLYSLQIYIGPTPTPTRPACRRISVRISSPSASALRPSSSATTGLVRDRTASKNALISASRGSSAVIAGLAT
jgi:hypothetical protein